MPAYTKQPISIAEQLTILKSRGLLFDDEHAAIKYLKIISYFRFANYWKPMERDKLNHLFKPNSKFENVVTLYNFDKELRSLIFSAIQNIEIALRTKIIQIVSSNYGAFWFSDENILGNHNYLKSCKIRGFKTEPYSKKNYTPKSAV